jgi:hypothetical protein
MITKFDEFLKTKKMVEVIITYDISKEFDPFYSKFKTWLESQNPSTLTESTYKLKGFYYFEQLEKFEIEIIKIFDESQKIFESKSTATYKSVIIFIIPENNQLLEKVILNKTKEK